MKTWIDESGELISLIKALKSFDCDESIVGILVLTCDGNGFKKEDMDPTLMSLEKNVTGGIFPGLIHGGKMHEKGSVLLGFSEAIDTLILENIDQTPLDLSDLLDTIGHDAKTLIVNFDGLSSGVEAFKEELFYNLGLRLNYIGGGSGSLSFEKKPCVISNKGLLQDAAVITSLKTPSGIGVAHGWQKNSDVLKVTESEKNRIISLNWEPAFKVYEEIVEKLSGLSFKENDFFDIAKAYPFGIYKIGSDFVVRDPIGVEEDQSMICVGEVPENAFVYILTGNKESLIEGAISAKKMALESYEEINGPINERPHLTFVVDCISRVLFLGDDFQEELNAIASEGQIGALTLGELANTGQAYLELYNKTSVVGILGGK